MSKKWRPETLAVRAGRETSQFGEHSQAIFATSSFTYSTAAAAEELFALREEGYTYSRTANPTVAAFENRMAALEGSERAIATASGMAAIQAVMQTFLKAGDHVLSSRSLFGSTMGLLNLLPNFGIEVSFVDLVDVKAWQAAIQPNTRLLFLETPSNPLGEVADLEKLAALAHEHNALLAVDNCFCSPVVQQPLRHGADIVLASATKLIDGQGRVMGGIICADAAKVALLHQHVRTCGEILSPFSAWVLLSGLETLFVRVQKQSETALELAQWLKRLPEISQVFYTGLPEHPQAALIHTQQTSGGVVLAFEVKGGQEAAWKIIDNVQLFSRTGNLGDVKSTITHPYTTTHGRLAPEVKAAAGISPGLIRLSIGLEHIEDLKADLLQAF